jgi:thioredoxin 1
MKKLEYYSASWCGPCKMVKPIVKSLKEEGLNIEIIDIDSDQTTVAHKGIYSVPTFVLYEKGIEIGRVSGVPSEKDIREWLTSDE